MQLHRPCSKAEKRCKRAITLGRHYSSLDSRMPVSCLFTVDTDVAYPPPLRVLESSFRDLYTLSCPRSHKKTTFMILNVERFCLRTYQQASSWLCYTSRVLLSSRPLTSWLLTRARPVIASKPVHVQHACNPRDEPAQCGQCRLELCGPRARCGCVWSPTRYD